MKRHERETLLVAEEAGARECALVGGGKHVKLVGVLNGRPFKIPIPGERGDHRSIRNFRADLRRRARASA